MPEDARPILNAVADQLQAAGLDNCRSDARLLLGLACGRTDPILPHEDLPRWTPEEQGVLDGLVARRLTGEPISRMRGWREFWSLRFALSPATLDPRPDSEILVEHAVAFGRSLAPSVPAPLILDMGTGSGCLLLASLSELPTACGVGIDLNPNAVTTAQDNAVTLGLEDRVTFCQRSFTAPADTDWPAGENQPAFDIILCNPPYIPSDDIAALAPDVAQFDPILALDGGADGLDCWRALLPPLAALLAPHGRAFVEIGEGQRPAVTAVAVALGLKEITYHRDLAGIIRVLVFGRSESAA